MARNDGIDGYIPSTHVLIEQKGLVKYQGNHLKEERSFYRESVGVEISGL